MDRRLGMGIAAGLVLAAVLAWLLPKAPAPVQGLPAPEPEPVDAVPSRRPAGGEVAEAKVEAEAAPEVPRTPVEVALERVAEAAGDGIVRCPLPPGAPEGLPRGFTRAERVGRMVVATVSQPEGRALLHRPRVELPPDATDDEIREAVEIGNAPPYATAVWSGAFPGEQGRCHVEPVEYVTLSGRVDFLDGPIRGSLHGCGGSRSVDEEGRFAFDAPLGPPCGLSFRSKGMGGEVMVDPAAPPAEIVVPEQPERPMAERLDEMRAEVEYLTTTPDPVVLALEEEGLSAEVEATLREWAEAQAAEREVRIESLAHMADFFEEALAKREAEGE